MSKIRRVDIPEIGTVEIKTITFGVASDIRSRILELEGDERSNEFAISVIEAMVQDPSLGKEQIASLSDDSFEVLCKIASEVMAMEDEFEELHDIKDVRERLYQAEMLKWRRFGEQIKSTLAINTARVVASLQESIGKAIVNPISADLAKAASEMLKPYENTIGKMAAISTRISAPHNYANIMQSSGEALSKAFQNLGPKISFRSMVDNVSKSLPAEPLLSSALSVSGLNSASVHSYTYPIQEQSPLSVEHWEEATRKSVQNRKVDAFDTLSSLEQLLRELIEERMLSEFGNKWWIQKVPSDVRDGCEERKANKEKPHRPSFHPIYYAYIDDYQKIISRSDNWDRVFKEIFGNKVEFQACMIWIQNVRDPVAHSRPITDAEYLQLIAGARWIRDRIDWALASDNRLSI